MKALVLTAVFSLLIVGCGEKMDELKQGMDAMKTVTEAASEIKDNIGDAEKMYKERAERGDTVAMPYKELQAFLPESVSGLEADGGPSGQQTAMGAFTFSTAEQKWKNGNGGQVTVKITDLGGTQGAYAMMGGAFMLTMSSEDDHKRENGGKVDDMDYTYAMERYNKDNHNTEITLTTRYRYMINVMGNGLQEDNSGMMMDLAKSIASKLKDK